jgi:predicted HicB family RNase H-like nuclease
VPEAKPKTRKPGRPSLPKGEAKGETLRIRVTPNELRGYGAKAKTGKQSVSEWIRSTLNAAMEA